MKFNRKWKNIRKLQRRGTYQVSYLTQKIRIKENWYEVGDSLWVVYFPLILRTKITRVDYCFKNRHPCAVLEYSIDEPCGHDLQEFELYQTFEQALEKYGKILKEDKEFFAEEKHEFALKDTTLEEERVSSARFILITHLPPDIWGRRDLVPEEQITDFIQKYYPNPKIRGKDWFNYQDLVNEKYF